MPVDTTTGVWGPENSLKQKELRELCRKFRFPLANGPRFSGKTIGCQHAFVEHGWNTPRGNDCIITCSQTVGIDSGIWKEFTETVIPEWIDGDFGLRWVREPYVMGVSKKPTCSILNRKSLELDNPDHLTENELKRAGAVTVFQLESLKDEKEVEDRFKPRKYTGMYVPELTTFHARKTFDTWTECLRLTNPEPGTKFLFLADTNPPDDDSWWIHDLWWLLLEDTDDTDEGIREFLESSLEDPSDEQITALIPPTRILKKQLIRIDIAVEDNPYADPEHVALLKAKYAHNKELYERYIEGKCVRTTEGSLFVKNFRESFHVIGEEQSPGNLTPEVIYPSEETYELITGTDPGPVNYSFHIVEKIILDREAFPQYAGKPIFNTLDELVLVKEDYDLNDVVEQCVAKMQFWEKLCARKFSWVHWSDRSVFDTKVPFTDKFWHAIVYELSRGLIDFKAAERGKGSVNQRIELFDRMLFSDRIFFNKNFTPKTIAMVKGIKKGKTSVGGISRGSPHKHPFDSLTYVVSSECSDELAKSIIQQIRQLRNEKQTSSLVSVPL